MEDERKLTPDEIDNIMLEETTNIFIEKSDNSKSAMNIANWLLELKSRRENDTVVFHAVELQEPKEPFTDKVTSPLDNTDILIDNIFICPDCGSYLANVNDKEFPNYCQSCGQKLLWRNYNKWTNTVEFYP